MLPCVSAYESSLALPVGEGGFLPNLYKCIIETQSRFDFLWPWSHV